MPEHSAGLAAKYAFGRMQRLLFPFRPTRWLSVYAGQLLRLNRADPVSTELRRIRPYYKGTRLLTAAGFAFILLAFILPFCVLFVDVQTFTFILLIYAVAFILASLLGMAIQSGMDAIFALQQQRGLTFRQAVQEYWSLIGSRSDLTLGYMAIKMAVDFSLSTLALLFFLPMLLFAMNLMIFVANGVSDGIDLGSTPYVGLALVAALGLLGFVATLLIALPATAFYGYYTEEAVKMMQEAQPEAVLHQEKA